MLAAALGCLPPAIDPMLLTLLSAAGIVPLAAHGTIVGTSQAGAALGSLAVWRFGTRLGWRPIAGAALLAALCSVLTAACASLPALLLLRGLYGAAMGMVFAHAMARCAAHRPSTAYGGMFLLQLLLATLVSLVLPALAEARGPASALAAMALAPALAAAMLIVASTGLEPVAVRPAIIGSAAVPPAGWALAAANFAVICATMLVWSFSGALAAAAGIGERMIGEAVALGSLAGAVTAIAVMRERLVMPLPLTALLGAALIVSPLLATSTGAGHAFIAAIIALNVGSTALIVRCSGLATGASPNPRFRMFVACTHSLGMIAGPLLGSFLFADAGIMGLAAGAAAILAAGVAAAAFAFNRGTGRGSLLARVLSTGSATKARQSA